LTENELRELVSKYPINEHDKGKEYYLFIRSIVKIRKTLKSLAEVETQGEEVESSP
jgi:hypothetical protein